MSGVEVAGLVLGCLPLIIQGIESYNEGLDPIKSFMRWEQQLPQFIRKLRTQHVHYALSIRYLLEPITSEVELDEMLADPGSSQQLWKSKEMALRLQDRLQESYQAYHNTITDIERITKLIASKLDLERATELTRNDLESLVAANPKKGDKFELRKRIRFGMNKKTIKGLLNELDECNKELERFSEKTEKIQTYRKSVKPANATRVRRLQGYAKSLHDSLTLCWSCACRSSHRSNLQLDPRDDLFDRGPKKATISSKISFNVSFSTLDTDNKQTPWLWQAAEISIEDEPEEDTANLTAFSPSKSKIAKTVSFGTPPPYSVDDPIIASAGPLEEVKDLCASIQQLKGKSAIGFSLDSKSILRGVYRVDTVRKIPSSPGAISLDDLLARPSVLGGKRTKLSKRDRYSLALTLACSVLYLNSTPWLTNQWTAKDIFFHKSGTTPCDIDIEHPYVAPGTVNLTTGQSPCSWKNKNTVLLALAIALLELYFGITAEKYQESEHGATDPALHQNPWQLCSMVHTWAEESQDDLSAAFLSAVKHCLHCFSEPGASLQDAEFLQAAVEGIVLPLQEELSHFLGKSMT
ncbi:hypothetical protein IAQ61_012043 [Plenodomus lingam]|uniref:uncharacterized protein n=1 Tax=Leptosphaeria maculans TaxID=5022 RepID=UPI00331A930F|nr:hypothetical protein IAQ61_012043 [Plenodomus lingam]